MNKHIPIILLILICGCLEKTATVDGKPVKIINDKNGNPYVIQFIDSNTGKTLYSKNVNTDPGIVDRIKYTDQIPYLYLIISIIIIIIAYLLLKVWKLGKDEGDEKDENENNSKHTASADSSRSGKRRK